MTSLTTHGGIARGFAVSKRPWLAMLVLILEILRNFVTKAKKALHWKCWMCYPILLSGPHSYMCVYLSGAFGSLLIGMLGGYDLPGEVGRVSSSSDWQPLR